MRSRAEMEGEIYGEGFARILKIFFDFMIFLLHQFYDFLVASVFNFPQIFEKFIP